MKIRKIRNFCIENKLLKEGDKVLLGLSGGADSVCLLLALLELKEEFDLTISAIHVHHGIRGPEADRDEDFCSRLCLSKGVSFGAFHVDVPALAAAFGDTLEEAGRKARYEILNNVAKEKGYNKIAVAHHKNDQAETVLFQMIRGSRLTGLTGIKAVQGNIIRPLLCLDRKEILEYLAENNQDFVTDSTNEINDAARNVMRNEVLPQLSRIQSSAVEHICETAGYLKRVDDFFEKSADELFTRAVQVESGKTVVSIPVLQNAPELIAEKVLYNVLCKVSGRKKDITHKHVESAVALMDMQTGAMLDFKYGIQGEKAFESLIFTEKNRFDIDSSNCNNTSDAETDLFVRTLQRLPGEVTLDFINRAGGFGKAGYRKLLDIDALKLGFSDFSEGKIKARQAENSDYITVFSDGRRKKVFDLLMESKVPAKARCEKIVAACGNEVFMIQGMRGCEGYRVTDNTDSILIVEFL